MIRPATAADAPAIAAIYNHFIAQTTVSFEEEPVSAAQMAQRISDIQAIPLPWLVAEQEGKVAGYAYASRWRARSAYRYAVETSIYLAHDRCRNGLGSQLYETLFSALQTLGVRTIISGIALPNPPSVALHEKFGLQKVAHFEKVGFKNGQWLDVGYWQKNI